MEKSLLLWMGLAFSIIVVIIGFIIDGQGQGNDNGLISAGLGLIFTGAFCVFLFTSCLAWDGVVKCLQSCCGAGVRVTGGVNAVTNPNNPAGTQLHGAIALQTFPSPSQQQLLQATPQTPRFQLQQPQPQTLLAVRPQNLRVVGIDGSGNMIVQAVAPTVPVASSSLIMVPQYSTQQQFHQPPLYNAYK